MELSLGIVLQHKRKEKNLTQQDVANFMNVSKVAVSKWENGQSYPDITFLPLLATYFDMTIDELLNYQPQLTSEEIQHLYGSLQHDLHQKKSQETWDTLQRLVKQYYSCYPFVFQMASFVLNHYDLLPGTSLAEKEQIYLPVVLNYLAHVEKNSQDGNLLDQGKKLRAYCYLLLNQPDKTLELLGKFIPTYLPSNGLIAKAYQLKGDLALASSTTQSGIFQNVVFLMSDLTNYLSLLVANPQKFLETFLIEDKIVTLFSLTTANPAVVVNFYLSAITGFLQQDNKEEVLILLEKLVALMADNYPTLTFASNVYFDEITDWLQKETVGGLTPRSSEEVFKDLGDFILHFPALHPYQREPRLKKIRKKVQLLLEKEFPHA